MALTESENDANGLLLVPMYCSFCGKGEMVNPDDLNAAQQKLMSHDQRCEKNPLVTQLRTTRAALAEAEATLERVRGLVKEWRKSNKKIPVRYRNGVSNCADELESVLQGAKP